MRESKPFLRILRALFKALVAFFALIGFVLTAGFLAQHFGLTKVPGAIDWRSRYYETASAGTDDTVLPTEANRKREPWQDSEEWQVLKKALIKDAPIIRKAAADAGVSPRLITSMIVGEQLRLFTSDREVYKQVFAPLSILGVQTQFSLGVTGIKYDTAKQIENNLKATNSPFYLGENTAHILDFSTTSDIENLRLTRLTEEHDHYYSYLYTGVFLRQIMSQWQKAGFNIDNRAEILATIFNIGFAKSKPNASPLIGGAEIEIAGKKYTFGGLAGDFYYSDEILNELPR